MADEARLLRGSGDLRTTAAAAIAAYEVQQQSGECAVFSRSNAVASGELAYWNTLGNYTMLKTAGIVLLDGDEAWWDWTNNKITYYKADARSFYAGRIVGDTTSAATTCVVNINKQVRYDLDFQRDACLSVPTGTQVLGAFGLPKHFGGAVLLELDGQNQAQCIDLLTVDRFSRDANAIVDIWLRVPVNGTGSDVDFNVGIADGTHATDADSITAGLFFHIDGGSTTINAQSKDGTTTVAAVTTGTTLTAGSAATNRIHLTIDTRNPADVQLYVNRVNVAPASVFRIDNAAATLGLLAHLEKTTGTQTGQYAIDRFTARCGEI